MFELEGVSPEPRLEYVTIGGEDQLETVAVPENPVIARRRLLLATHEALPELQGQGVIVAVDAGPLGDEDSGPPVIGGARSVPYQFGGTSDGVKGISDGRFDPTGMAFVLVHRYRDRESWFLDFDLFVADLSNLGLDPRTIRSLEECLAAYRRGLYLASASLLGAAVEGAWYAVGEELRDRDAGLARALDSPTNTAQVQRRVADRLGTAKQDLLAHAAFMRDLRNYGVHPRATETEELERFFTEEACAYLIMTSYHHLRRLGEIAEGLRQGAADGESGSTDS